MSFKKMFCFHVLNILMIKQSSFTGQFICLLPFVHWRLRYRKTFYNSKSRYIFYKNKYLLCFFGNNFSRFFSCKQVWRCTAIYCPFTCCPNRI